jgi:hypothetical protein
MAIKRRPSFNSTSFLAKVGKGRSMGKYRKGQVIFSQGDAGDAVFYVHRCAFRRSRPLIPTDRDQLFRSIATNAARVLRAPLDDGGDVSLLWVGQARREAVPVVDRRGLRVPRSAHTADAAARAGGPC